MTLWPVALAALLASGTLLACGGSTPPAGKPDEVTVVDHRDGSGSGVPASTSQPPAPVRTREEMIAAAMARVPAITEVLATLRGRSLAPVPASLQSKDDFRVYAAEQAKAEAGTRDMAAYSRGLASVGLLDRDLDLVGTYARALASDGVAYYDPKDKALKVVVVREDDAEFDMVAAQELTHALQDQHFDLGGYITPMMSEDVINARRFVVEGDAMFVAFAYLIKSSTGKDPLVAPVLGLLGKQQSSYGTMSTADMAGMVTGDINMVMSLQDLPPYVLMPRFEAYLKGAYMAYVAFAAGGWAAVDALYSTAPPTSTEQVLHPVEKLVCVRDEPVAISIPKTAAGKGWSQLASGIAGEMGVRVYGTTWKEPETTAMAAGWDGDAWTVFTTPGAPSKRGFPGSPGATMALWATAWDSTADADEFAAAMKRSLALRKVPGNVETKGTRVDVAIGCEGTSCAAPLAALAKLHPKKVAKPVALTERETACIATFAPAAT